MSLITDEAAQQLALWLGKSITSGASPLASADSLVEAYRADARYKHDEERVDALIRWETGKSFTAGFITHLGGLLTLPVSLPASVAVTWLLQARMAAAVAKLRGHDIEDPRVQAMVLASLTGSVAPQTLRAFGVRAGEWAAGRMVQRVSEKTLMRVNQRIGFHLLTTAGQRGLLQVARFVPVAGAAVGGAIDAYGSRKVARAAKALFLHARALPAFAT